MRRFFYQSALFVLLLLATPFPAAAATIATTTISSDTHWTLEGSPYVVQSALTIKAGATLSIDPGVVVKLFNNPIGGTAIAVSGTLIAGGSTPTSAEVTFTSIADDTVGGDTNGDGASTTPEQNRWGAIQFQSAGGATSTISHARFKYGGATGGSGSTVLSVQGANTTVNGQSVLVGARVLIANTVFESVPGYQVYMGGRGIVDFERDTFEGQRYIARFWTTPSDTSPTTLIAHQSSFNNVSGAAIDYYYGTFVVDLSNNWWGVASGPYEATGNPTGKANVGRTTYTTLTVLPFLACDPSVDSSCLPADPVPDPCATPGACVDNVLFLPGIEGSRLYEGASCTGTGEEQEWEPTSLHGDANVQALLMDSSGKSICNDVYVKEGDVISTIGSTDYYASFLSDLDTLKTAGTMNDWKAVAYDWRLSLDTLLANGTQTGNHISYLTASSTPYIEQTLRALAATSKTGKVTIVAHSNGGLVAKALMQKLGDSDASALVDRIILVGVPQSGTPAALGALLFGYDQGIAVINLLSIKFFYIIHDWVARLLANTMPMAYHLLPSTAYLESTASDTAHPLVQFEGSSYVDEAGAYGAVISSRTALDDYILAHGNDRTQPAQQDLITASVGNTSLLNQANTEHASIDAWIPPLSIEVDQIAGWGDNSTLAGIDFYTTSPTTAISPAEAVLREYRPKFTEDGDGTVPVPSALLIPEASNVKRYWMNLKNSSTDHGTLLGNSQLVTFIRQILEGSTSTPSTIFSTSAPVSGGDKKLIFYLHSPLTLGLYDSSGNYTGSGVDGSVEKNIPGSEYGMFGTVQYVIAPFGPEYQLKMLGTGKGTFSLDVNESTNGVVAASSTVANVPVTASTTVTMSYTALSDNPELSVDENGDGSDIFTVAPVAGQIVFYTAPIVEATTTTTTTDPSSDSGGDATDTSSSGDSSSNNSDSGTTTYAPLPPGSYPAAPAPSEPATPAPTPVVTETSPSIQTVSAGSSAGSVTTSVVSVPAESVTPAQTLVPTVSAASAGEPSSIRIVPSDNISEPVVQSVVIETTPTQPVSTSAPAQDLSQTASAINAVSGAGILGFFESLYNMVMQLLHAIYVFILQIL